MTWNNHSEIRGRYYLVLLVRDFPRVSKTCWILGEMSTHCSKIILSKDKKMPILFVIAHQSPLEKCKKCKWIVPCWPTISIVVVDSAQPSGGCQMFGCDSHVDGVAQVKLYSYTKATFHKHKVSEPVNAHSFTKMIWSTSQYSKEMVWLSHSLNENKTYHFGKPALHLELKGCLESGSFDVLKPNRGQTSSLKPEVGENKMHLGARKKQTNNWFQVTGVECHTLVQSPPPSHTVLM